MWIKFADRLVNFNMAYSVDVVVNDMGADVVVYFPDDGCPLLETFSTPRAAQDRFDALAGMLTGQAISLGVKR